MAVFIMRRYHEGSVEDDVWGALGGCTNMIGEDGRVHMGAGGEGGGRGESSAGGERMIAAGGGDGIRPLRRAEVEEVESVISNRSLEMTDAGKRDDH